MNVKKQARIRRARRARAKINELGVNRLCVYRTPRHMYAQIIAPTGGEILVAASTVEKEQRGSTTGNIEAASKIGALIAERAKEAGISKVAFDRSGFNYHGRVKALADAAREGGLEF
ncbi:50S ribosomal protein L18 [Pseudohongiella nitratireducens]|uniref:Large ribosomal subunit protein uL18 n=1 Tax=Pseudohongiella nitratireducens TaxID=1768907 RepID=A0A916VJT5_9GAMM|nr:50S ribosomal protein L18 [Pseudohongiella nitratireducens]MDF1624519.1 50S ribosomal protein L18 [Pseudohongiella nitratireducens]GFZ77973.1 50S ribosomal protein L18 [Pseudohongiella nitratireducens]|tara:strand:- start:3185 stop:3535 length:351 start_codon:yes stop_codon:yes gene_type:complete